MWLAFIAGQLYLLARLAIKLHFVASQTALFQSHLAHATYTAAPAPAWPESPAAEAIARHVAGLEAALRHDAERRRARRVAQLHLDRVVTRRERGDRRSRR